MDTFMPVRPLIIATLIAVTGCAGANHYTVNRTTGLSSSKADPDGVAIHLDAHQRLVLHGAREFCAEPSPDAFQVYLQILRASLNQGFRKPASLETMASSFGKNIGSRTQSITIMRDSLFRLCEAYNNNQIGEVMVATFLNRSIDLAAVILAVEKLTDFGILRGSNHDHDAARPVANAVQAMVSEVLKKDYSRESCMAYLTQGGPESNKSTENDGSIGDVCTKLITTGIKEGIRESQSKLDSCQLALDGIIKRQGEPLEIIQTWLQNKFSGYINLRDLQQDTYVHLNLQNDVLRHLRKIINEVPSAWQALLQTDESLKKCMDHVKKTG